MYNIDLSAFPTDLQQILLKFYQDKYTDAVINMKDKNLILTDESLLSVIKAEINIFKRLWNRDNLPYLNKNDLCLNKHNIGMLDLPHIKKVIWELISDYKNNEFNLELFNIDLIDTLSTIFSIRKSEIKKVPDVINTEISDLLALKENKSAVLNSDTEDTYKNFALCHHCYEKPKVNEYSAEIVTGECYRNEKYYSKFRLPKFSMTEVVFWGDEEKLFEHREEILFLFLCIGESLGEKYRIKIANDSFLSDNLEVILYQILNKSKLELEVYSSEENKYISIASLNFHGSYFTRKFSITSDNQSYLQSMCVGFGLNRISEIFKEIKNGTVYNC